MQKDVMREVLTARRDYEKWKALATALGGVDADAGKEPGGKEVRIITSNSASGIT
jgi:hypothetical protein